MDRQVREFNKDLFTTDVSLSEWRGKEIGIADSCRLLICSDEMIEYAINNSRVLKDKHWKDALNAISRIPPSGRILKVVFKITNQKRFVITAFWID